MSKMDKIEDVILCLGAVAMFIALLCNNDTAVVIAMSITVGIETLLLILEGIIDMFFAEDEED